MKMKKFTAVILALVMVFAMSANAFAATNATASLTVSYDGEPLLEETVNVTSGMTAKAMLDQYQDYLDLVWGTVPNLNPNPAFSSTAYMGFSSLAHPCLLSMKGTSLCASRISKPL